MIFHISYTAKDDGVYRQKVETHLRDLVLGNAGNNAATEPLLRLFDLKNDFPNAWHHFRENDGTDFEITLEDRHFPYFTGTLVKP